MNRKLVALLAGILAVSAATAISFAQRRPDPTEKPISGDFKITIKTTTAGHSSQSTTMIKGQRERSETNMMVGGMNMGSVHITQCDLKRTIQINDRARKYTITPMDADDTSTGPGAIRGGAAGGPSQGGGVVTMTVNTVDTGERKEMFGLTARHLKRTTTMESSPDACYDQKMRIDTDGWYVNLEYGLNCGTAAPAQMGGRGMAPGGCRDRYQYKHSGPNHLGYPLLETMTMYGPDGKATFTSTKEVTEMSRQPLDVALFDVPAGYIEAKNQQEMSGTPSMEEIMAAARQQSGQTEGRADNAPSGMPATASTAARVRIGVVEFNNKSKSSLSPDSLREQLIAMLNGEGIDAIALNASSQGEAVIEAKAKQCAYILYTDIASLKAASAGKKLGGFLGRATGVDTGSSGKAEAKLDFRLVPVGSSSPIIQSSATAKEDSEQASATAAIESEAKAVAAAVPKT